MKKRNVLLNVFSLACSIALLLPCVIGTTAATERLSIDCDPDRVTSNLTLPGSAGNGVTVSWQALDANTLGATTAMTNTGKVTRPAYGENDAAVIMRATLSDGSTRDFHLIVPSLDAEDARDMITVNPGFESAAPADGKSAPEGWLKHTKWSWVNGKSDVTETTYAQTDKSVSFTGAQSLRINVDQAMHNIMTNAKGLDDPNDYFKTRTASVQNDHVFTAREGHRYTLQVMAYSESSAVNPSISLVFFDNEGNVLMKETVAYYSASTNSGRWKNLSVSACAPAGAVMAAAVLDGGSEVGTSWFDNVRLRELPLVANGSFDLGTAGWTTSGTAGNGVLTLNSGVAATSAALPANRGVAYYLTVEGQGSGTAALRFMNSSKSTLKDYTVNLTTGTNSFYAYAPANTANMSVVLTGGSGGLAVSDVKITRAPSGTYVEDGSFEFSASEGKGSPWDLSSATIGASTGRSGAGLTINSYSGKAMSAIIPIMDGKSYTFTADVMGTRGTMTIELYYLDRSTNTYVKSTNNSYGTYEISAKSTSSDWNTIRCTFDPVPEVFTYSNSVLEHAYARINLSGYKAVFDNVAVYSITDSVSNASVENINYGEYGSFPYNWSAYGTAAGFVANQAGQATEGIKSLGVELFSLGEGGVRSSMVRAEGGKSYEATVKAMGSGVSLNIEFWNASFAKLSGGVSKTVSSKNWTEYSVTGTAPAGTAYVSLSVGGSGSGLAYLDEASIVPVVRNIGSNVQLFLDDWLVAESKNVERTLHQGEKMDEIKIPAWYGTVVWNKELGKYQMWHQYSDSKIGVPAYSVLYRESADGITWTDYSYENICQRADGTGTEFQGPSVFLDWEEEDASKRYKMVCYIKRDGYYYLFTSGDGINWTEHGKIQRGSDVIKVAYDPVNKQYVATYKTTRHQADTPFKRAQNVAVSDDLINWTEGVHMYSIATPQDMMSGDYLRADSYSTTVYPLGDSYIGINWLLLLTENEGFSGIMEAPLLFSRDVTEDWQRIYDENGDPFMAIPRGNAGKWDDAQIYANSYPVQVGDETWWYYDGSVGGHFSGNVPISNPGYISAVKWRRNGFASLDFGTNGTMTTELFTLDCEGVFLNAKGNLTVELLDQGGNVLATAQFNGDSVNRVLTWNKSVTNCLGQPVRLRFTGSNAQLYSLQVNDAHTYDVQVADAQHGTVTVDITSGIIGTPVTVTAIPDDGFKLDKILVDGKAIKGNSFDISGTHTVTATFIPQYSLFYEDFSSGSVSENVFTNIGTSITDNGANTLSLTTQDGATVLAMIGETTNPGKHKGTAPNWSTNFAAGDSYEITMRLKNSWNNNTEALIIYLPGVEINVEGTNKYYALWLGGVSATNSHLRLRQRPGNASTGSKAVSATNVQADEWITLKIVVDETVTVFLNGTELTGLITGNEVVKTGEHKLIMDVVDSADYTGTATTYVDYINVEDVPAKCPVTVTQPANGRITVTGADDLTSVEEGTKLTVVPSANTGYKLTAILVDGKAIDGNTFTVTSNHTVTAVFEREGAPFGYCGGEGDGTNLTWTLNDDGELIIEGTGAMMSWGVSNSVPWVAHCDSITAVTIGNGVTTVGNRAFYGCYDLTSVDMSDSVTAIGDYTFSGCFSLSDVTISNNLLAIGSSAFLSCASLTSLTIPNSVTTIGDGVFEGCDALTIYCKGGSAAQVYAEENNIPFVAEFDLGTPVVTVSNNASTGKPVLTWNKVEGAEKYEVYRATSSTGTYTKLTTLTGTKLTNTSAVAGQTYYYKVRAVAGESKGDFSQVKAQTCTLAQPVVALELNSKGNPVLIWNKVTGASKYDIYRATSMNGTYTKLTTITGTKLINTSATLGTVYYYKVVAVCGTNSAGNSAYSAVKYTRALAAPVVTVSNNAAGKPVLTWNKVTGAEKYEVYRATSATGAYTKLTTTTGTKLTNTSAEAGTTYYYKVRAITGTISKSQFSDVKYSSTCVLAKPVVTVTLNTSGKPVLSWNKVDGAVKYEVYRATSSTGTYTKLTTITGTKLTNTSAVVGTTYYYKVRAVSGENMGEFSDIKYSTCVLAKPVVTVTLNTSGKPVLSWNKVDGAVKYEVYRATSSTGTYTKLTTITGTKLTNTSAVVGTTYYYKVRAVSGENMGEFSEIKSIKSN